MKKSRKKVSRKKVARKKKVLVIRTGTRSTSELQAELFKELKARWKEVDARYLPGRPRPKGNPGGPSAHTQLGAIRHEGLSRLHGNEAPRWLRSMSLRMVGAGALCPCLPRVAARS